MSKKIKGITVEIGGDTTGLDKALKGVNKEIGNTQSELKEVDKLLKLDPTNTTLLQQKQILLAKSISGTKDKLDVLKTAEKQAQKQFEAGKVSAESYRALQREVEATEQSLVGLKGQAETTNKTLSGLDKSGKITTGTVAAGNIFSSALTKMYDSAKAAAEETREYRREIGYLKTNAEQSGESFEDLEKKLIEVTSITNDNGAAIEGFSNLLQAGFSKDKLDSITNNLIGATIKWKDTLKFEGLADGLQETLATGSAVGQFGELLERMGMNLEEFNTRLAECSTEAERQDLVLTTLSESGLASAKEEYEAQNKTLIENSTAQAELNAQMADAAEKIEPLLTLVTQFTTAVLSWVNNNPELTAAIVAIVVVLTSVFKAISAINSVMTLANSTMLASPTTWIILGIVAAVTALIAIIVLCVKHFDTIKAVALDVWEKIAYGAKKAWQGILSAITTVINAILEGINLMVEVALAPINLLIKGLNLIPGVSIKELQFKIKEIKLPEMPKLALGGNVMVGEAGPEILTHFGNRVQVTPLTGQGASRALGGTLFDVVAAINKINKMLTRAQRVNKFYIGGEKVGEAIQPTVSRGLYKSSLGRKRATG